LLDFGSGPATAILAAREVWPESLHEITAIEPSNDMMLAGNKLFNYQTEQSNFTPAQIYWRSYLTDSTIRPSNDNRAKVNNDTFDVVIAAYSLNELPGIDVRNRMIKSLWNKAKNILIIIEPGTPLGFKNILDCRQTILDMTKPEEKGYVLAPCPHDGACGLLGTTSWCHFEQRMATTKAIRLSKLAFKNEKFSYVILKRGERPKRAVVQDSNIIKENIEVKEEKINNVSLEEDANHWPRIIRPPRKKPRHVLLDLCLPDKNVVTKLIPHSVGPTQFRLAKKSEWGDLWPY